MSDSGDSTGFSDTASNAENEEAKVSDTISSHKNMEEVNNQKNQDASGASSENFTSADLTAGYNALFNPSVSNSSSELSLNSRDDGHNRCKKNVTKQNRTKKRNKRPIKTDLDDIPEDTLEESKQRIDSSIPCKFDQIVYMDNVKGKTYSFRYFKAYKFDWRLAMNYQNEKPMSCTCPRGRLHNQQCPWYHPEVINVPDIENTLSTSEQAAQGKIYDMYHQNSQNVQQESCGCGTAAEIAYMGHKSTCVEFQWIYERSSYEMLLAVLKKRKKVTLFENIQQQCKRPRLKSPSGLDTNEDITKGTKTDVNMDNPSTPTTPTTATNSLAVLAEVAQSHSSQSSLPDLIGEQNGGNGGADCPCEEDEEMPPLEDADITEL